MQEVSIYTLKDLLEKTKDISYNSLKIPDYQRAYKWKIKNVRELYDDIQQFCSKGKQYRLGTIVLYKNKGSDYDIVDGQQRLVTLALMLYSDDQHKENLGDFLENKFQHSESQQHIAENFGYIKSLAKIRDNFLSQLEFVVVVLDEIEEAFQFFDSQNSRGKELEAYDYLKAYHLREMHEPFNQRDSENIKHWESIEKKELADVFNTLFRIRSWSRSQGAWVLDKEHREEFYGVDETVLDYPCHTGEQTLYNLWKANIVRFPYQVNGIFIRGAMFFDAVHYYSKLYDRLKSLDFGPASVKETPEWKVLSEEYKGKWRTGDCYVRELLYATLMLYINKFNDVSLSAKHFAAILHFAYKIRMEYARVWWNRIEERAKKTDAEGVFQLIKKSATPDALDKYTYSSTHWQYLPEENSGHWHELKVKWSKTNY